MNGLAKTDSADGEALFVLVTTPRPIGLTAKRADNSHSYPAATASNSVEGHGCFIAALVHILALVDVPGAQKRL